jgi:hypothetical protein
MKVLQEDNNLCRCCGIAAGEAYDDGVELAKLNVARRKVAGVDGAVDYQLVTECKRCSAGGSADREADLLAFMERIETLSPMEQRAFAKWIEADRRSLSLIDQLWGVYRTLPIASRSAVAQALGVTAK